MDAFSITPLAMADSVWRHRDLIATLVRREVVGRYRGSLLGVLWSFVLPGLMLLVYTFVFGVVFKARWQGGGDSMAEFALLVFAGLIVFNWFAECVSRAPGLILAHRNYVTKVVFPLEVLAWVACGAAAFHALVSFAVWLLAYGCLIGWPHPVTLLLPLVLAPVALLILGVCWLLAALGVYLRDVAQFVGVATTVLLFLSPVFYPASALPAAYRPWLALNPLTPAIEQARALLFSHRLPDALSWGAYLSGCALFAWLGFVWFQRTRRGFADVL